MKERPQCRISGPTDSGSAVATRKDTSPRPSRAATGSSVAVSTAIAESGDGEQQNAHIERRSSPQRAHSTVRVDRADRRGRAQSAELRRESATAETFVRSGFYTPGHHSPNGRLGVTGAAVRTNSKARGTDQVAAMCASALCRRPPPFKTLPSAVMGGKYNIGRFLGRGASASVWEVLHDSNARFAVKVFDQGRDRNQAKREMRVLSRLQHPNVLEAVEIIESSLHCHLVCELVDGESLRAFAQRQPLHRLEESIAQKFYNQVVDGVHFCHERLVVHRDLKLENLLLNCSEAQVKIIDFGFATQVASKDAKLKAFCGTPSYMAPEIIRGENYSGFATDIWALGVVVFALLCGVLPFVGRNELQLYAKIRRGALWLPESLPELPRRLIRSMLRIDAVGRPSVGTVLQNAWLLGDTTGGSDTSTACVSDSHTSDHLAAHSFVSSSNETVCSAMGDGRFGASQCANVRESSDLCIKADAFPSFNEGLECSGPIVQPSHMRRPCTAGGN